MIKKQITSIQKVLNTWAIVMILWVMYRIYFKTNLPVWFDEFFAKPIIYLTPVYYFITTYEKSDFLKSIDLKTAKMKQHMLLGLSIGVVFFFTGFAVQYFKNGELNFISKTSILQILYYIIIAFASSFSEEILSRGFILKRLYQDSKSLIGSVFFASFLFFFLHIPILFSSPDLYGAVLLQVMATDILLSFAVSFLYLQRKSVMVPIFIHAFYNLSLYLLIS